MTNWMTGAGLALIAGGLATLISFRSVLFGGGERRSGRRQRRDVEAPRQRPALAAPAEDPAEESSTRRRGRRGRRRALVAAPGPHPGENDEPGGLASIGFADEILQDGDGDGDGDGDEDEDAPDVEADEPEEEPEPVAARTVDRSDRRYGDRVEGWVRPEYQEPADEPRPGEYWTPIPVDLAGDSEPSAKGYGWPLPVERLPAVPPYEPATGFDLVPVESEPTEVVPVWSESSDERPGRVRLPRSWAARNEKNDRGEKKNEPRRRPRPRPGPDTPVDNTTVYVSRHAAEPPR